MFLVCSDEIKASGQDEPKEPGRFSECALHKLTGGKMEKIQMNGGETSIFSIRHACW